MGNEADTRFLRRALRLAVRGRYATIPNPRVGAVLTRGGEIVGEGFHRQAGGPHAEIGALGHAGERAKGATLYVNLEPCAHHGRTPPCADALVGAGVERVVCCHRDPNPQVSGQGFERLRRAGVRVEVGQLAAEAVRLNLPFLVAQTHRRPAVTLKWAMSLDGRIATRSGESQWISSPPGRRWALELREEHDAILVGSGTALADDPRLDRRLGKAPGPNVRVILDRRLRLPAAARLFEVAGPVLLYTERRDPRAQAALEARGATVVELEEVSPASVLEDLFARGVRRLLVEGGGQVLAAFVAADLFDEVAVCCAPLLIGGERAPGPLGGEGVERLGSAPGLEGIEVGRRGRDLVLGARRRGRLEELLVACGAA